MSESTTTSPPVAGLRQSAPHLAPGWMPAIPALSWYTALRERHLALSESYAAAHAVLDRIEDERALRLSAYRRECRSALESGSAVPERPVDLGEAVVEARRELAAEDIAGAADELGDCVVDVLRVMRARRAELQPFLDRFDAPLRTALLSGPGAGRASVAERLKRELTSVQDGPAIEVFDDAA